MNVRGGGIAPGSRYEVDLLDSRRFSGCFVRGQIDDLRGTLDPRAQRTPSTRPAIRRALPTPSLSLRRSGLPTAGGIDYHSTYAETALYSRRPLAGSTAPH